MSKTLIVLNPHAAGGRAGKLWSTIEPLLWEYLGELVVAITESSADVAQHIDQAYQAGLTRVISIGGDGTNHSLINALVAHNDKHPDAPQMVYGMLPVGTGRDWARSVGIPFDIQSAAKWIATASPQDVDVGEVTIDQHSTYFLNVASVGISGEVVTRVEKAKRRPWTFLQATLRTLINYKPPQLTIRIDGENWYEGTSYLLAVANGTTFGRGMKIAPSADINDGLFDVILVEGMSKLKAVDALRRVYDGSHLDVDQIHHRQTSSLDILTGSHTLGMELDGEFAQGNALGFKLRQGLLKLLV